MIWEDAITLIRSNIHQDQSLDSSLTYRYVSEIPPYRCNNYSYGGTEGYKVQIGSQSYIEIPISMLQTVIEDAVNANRIYNKNVFCNHYPTRAEQKTGHPCHIHVIGKIFVLAGVTKQLNSRNYLIS